MRTLVHLSDLHFGRVDPRLPGPLADVISGLAPDVVVVSGDLTQRARRSQFIAARKFLDTLPQPQVVVPGNHDIPLYNVARRFLAPLDNYRRYVGTDVEPSFVDGEIAVLGVNTARSLTFKNGRINAQQIETIRARLAPLDDRIVRIIVSHHPFDLAEGVDENKLAGRAELAIHGLAGSGVDLWLSGHLHASHAGHTAKRYPIDGYAALVVQAGTATSTRGRGEVNSFNVLQIEDPSVRIERYGWDDAASTYLPYAAQVYQRKDNGWAAQ